MPKTKKELVEVILSYETTFTKANLMKKNLKQLEEILENINKDTNTNEVVRMSEGQVQGQVDMESLMAKMKAELMAELKEKAIAEAKAELETERQEVEQLKVEVANAPKPKPEIDRYKPIAVMNVSPHKLIYVSKRTGARWVWSKYSDVEWIEFQELLTIRSSERRLLDEPYMIILDDEVVEYMGLSKQYEKLDKSQLESLDKLFTLKQNNFQEAVESLPKGIQLTVIVRARELYEKGELDSVRKVNFLNERFNTDIGQRG